MVNLASCLLMFAGLGARVSAAQEADDICRQVSCDYDSFPDMSGFDESEVFMETSVPALGNLRAQRRKLANSLIDFEAVGNLVPVGNTYAPSGAIFSPNAFGLVDSDSPGSGAGSGNIGGLPSPVTGMFFFIGNAAVMNVPAGFQFGISFWYSAVNFPGTLSVFDGLGGTGNLLGTKVLPLTPFNGAPDPTGIFSPFFCDRVEFEGLAKSVVFGGLPNEIVFDDITCGRDSMPPGWGD